MQHAISAMNALSESLWNIKIQESPADQPETRWRSKVQDCLKPSLISESLLRYLGRSAHTAAIRPLSIPSANRDHSLHERCRHAVHRAAVSLPPATPTTGRRPCNKLSAHRCHYTVFKCCTLHHSRGQGLGEVVLIVFLTFLLQDRFRR